MSDKEKTILVVFCTVLFGLFTYFGGFKLLAFLAKTIKTLILHGQL